MLYFHNELSLIWRGFWNFEFEKMVVTDLTGLLMGDDIETGRSTGSDYWAALCWLSENQNNWP